MEQRRLHLVGINICHGVRVAQVVPDLDAGIDRTFDKVGGLPDQFVDIGRSELERLPARKGQEVTRHPATPLSRVLDRLKQGAQGRVVADIVQQNVAVAKNDRKKIVEVMRDASGQLPTVSSFCAWCNCASSNLRSVTSDIAPTMRRGVPASSRTMNALSAMSRHVPSLVLMR